MRWLKRGLLALILLLGLAAGGGWLWLRSTLPRTTGSITLAGLSGPVTVTRDQYGVPVIKAQATHDAYFALGFVHAQDRLFQMDLQRRLGQGKLAEVLGKAALPIDRQMRTFGLYRDATGALAHLGPEFRAVLDAYTDGVNAYLDQHRPLPVEFTVLRYQPGRWHPQDSLLFGKLMAIELSGNFRRELLRARLAAKLTPAQIAQMFPDYPQDGPVALERFGELYKLLPLDRMLASLPPIIGPTPASNNWVVDGSHSSTGKPLLANDPHLDYSTPGIWYLARLEAPGLDVAGGTLAGTPVVVLGHNDRIAWGYTTTNGDVEDLYIEQVDPTDPGRYLTPDGAVPFATRSETISVRGGKSQTITIRSTRHGPVISDAVPGAEASEGHVVALAATFLTADDRSVESQWLINRAGGWEAFTQALKLFVAPQQNMVYADVDGNIGFYAPGLVPLRKAGDGRAPVPGWTGEYDWAGTIPFDQLPHSFNPPSGHVATANNKIVPDDYPYLITRDWELPFRAERIERRLAEQPKQSIAASTSIMRDDISLTAQRLLPLMLAVAPTSEAQRKAHAMLESWDAAMDADRPEPLLFTAWLRALNRRIYADELGELFPQFLDANPLFVESVLTKYPAWCDDVSTPQVETCAAQVSGALDDALHELEQRYGADPAGWRWGEPHHAFFGHPVFRRIPVLRDLFDRSVAADGGTDTVNAGVFHFSDGVNPYLDVHGAGLRAIYDLGELERSVFMIAPGQSGNLLSPHYDDLLPLWRSFDWIRLPHDAKGDLLTLVPPS